MTKVTRPITWLVLLTLVSCTKSAPTSEADSNCVTMATARSPSQLVCFEEKDGWALIEGDIGIGKAADLRKAQAQSRDRAAVARAEGTAHRWPGGVVPVVVSSSLPNSARILDAMNHWAAQTNLRFITATTEADFVGVVAASNAGDCYSTAIGRAGGLQYIVLGSNCTTGNAIHEIGHTIGFWHEQAREDRDQFVAIHFENVTAGREAQFVQQIVWSEDIGLYDFGSIMHYPRLAFSANGQPTIVPRDGQSHPEMGQRSALSALDIQGANAIYSANFVEAPDFVVASAPSQTAATITFNDNSDDESGFIVEYATFAGSPHGTLSYSELTRVAAFTGAQHGRTFSLSGLTPQTNYSVRLRAYRGGAASAPSAPSEFSTLPNPPAAPTNVQVAAQPNLSLLVSWTASPGLVSSYRLEQASAASGPWSLVSTGLTISRFVSGLSPSTEYFFRVIASNSGGSSPPSAVASGMTLIAPPAAPANLAASAVSPSQINLSWGAVSGADSLTLQRGPAASGPWTDISLAGTDVSYADVGRSEATAYFYRIRANNVGGFSAFSNVANATTPYVPPVAPPAPVLTVLSATSVRINWTDVNNFETGYRVQRTTNPAGTWTTLATVFTPTQRVTTNSGLTAATNYYYRIKVLHPAGNVTSAYSRTKTSAPAAPTGLVATSIGSTSISIRWNNIPFNETTYRVFMAKGAGAYVQQTPAVPRDQTTFTASGLTRNTVYHFKVEAMNGVGPSAFSNIINPRTLP